MSKITWTCHICKQERPDHLIGVYKHQRDIGRGVLMTENVRYCLDKPSCRYGATTFHFIPEDKTI
jgi:hypothetical protein